MFRFIFVTCILLLVFSNVFSIKPTTTPQTPIKSCGMDFINRLEKVCGGGQPLIKHILCTELSSKCCDRGCTDAEIRECC